MAPSTIPKKPVDFGMAAPGVNAGGQKEGEATGSGRHARALEEGNRLTSGIGRQIAEGNDIPRRNTGLPEYAHQLHLVTGRAHEGLAFPSNAKIPGASLGRFIIEVTV
ncbi:MAG: hypothetical protein V1760_01100 [Candidatus Peregrinibacteria bacterium]